MKGSFGFASLLVTFIKASVDVGPWSYSQADETELFNANGIVWKITTKTAYDEDAGIEYFRIQHDLDANIKATDVVTFEIAFTSKSDPWTNKLTMAEDSVVCTMS